MLGISERTTRVRNKHGLNKDSFFVLVFADHDNPSKRKLINNTIRRRYNSSTRQSVDASIHRRDNPSTRQSVEGNNVTIQKLYQDKSSRQSIV